MLECLLYRYGVGYHMVVTKEDHCNTAAIIQCVTDTVTGSKMVCIKVSAKVNNFKVSGVTDNRCRERIIFHPSK